MLVGQKLGPILIEKELGSGAMGAVYRGVHTKTEQKLAVKVIAPGLSSTPSALARFEREAKILKQLNHQNIVRFYGTGTIHGQRFYAMEYIEGESLDHVMARRGRMTWEEVVDLGQQLCAGLQHAHEKGIVHRDLKPSNLMVCPDGTLKLTDFGIAKLEDATQLTEANCTVGTAAYMSPEQCRGERNIDYKSDLYSLGVLFYELITGRKPFKAESAMEMFVQHVQGKFERPSRIILDVPVWLDTLICQMMEKKPAQRPQNAAMVSSTLGSIQEKVEAQQSAGVAAVRGRKKDRPKGKRSLDEEDKEAARILAGKAKKKPPKKAPFFLGVWFQAACILTMLAGIGVALFLMLRPASAETLYKEAKVLYDAGDTNSLDKALNGPIATYLANYPNRKGPETEDILEWQEEIIYRQDEQLLLRYLEKKKAKAPLQVQAQGPAQEKAFEAIEKEDEGDLDNAKQLWTEVKEKFGSGSGHPHWGYFAKRHLREVIDFIFETEAQFRKDFDWIEKGGVEPRYNNEGMQETFQGYRYEWFGDPLMASRHFVELRKKYEDQQKQRLWYVMAGWKMRGLSAVLAKSPTLEKDRSKIEMKIKDKLNEAEADRRRNRNKAIGICLNIITLYDKDETLKEDVGKARALLQKLIPD